MVRMAERNWIRISIPAIFKGSSKPKTQNLVRGFTFLEILVVLTLVVLLMGMAVPQFFAMFSKPHETEFKHLNNVLKILRNDAVLKSTSYCLFFDLKTQKMMTANEEESGTCSGEFLKNPKILKPHFFSEDLILREAKLAETNYLSAGTAADVLEVHINSSGFVTPFFLLFTLPDSTNSWQIESKGIMGKLAMSEQ
jgi:prepilin-type N-terminal cleavage/methylation domain-containing protein